MALTLAKVTDGRTDIPLFLSVQPVVYSDLQVTLEEDSDSVVYPEVTPFVVERFHHGSAEEHLLHVLGCLAKPQ